MLIETNLDIIVVRSETLSLGGGDVAVSAHEALELRFEGRDEEPEDVGESLWLVNLKGSMTIQSGRAGGGGRRENDTQEDYSRGSGGHR